MKARTIGTVALMAALFSTGRAQHLYDAYDIPVGSTFPFTELSSNGLGTAFDGEYMIFTDDVFWSHLGIGTIWLKIEVVSFPFTPPLDGHLQVGERALYMPEPASYGHNPGPGHCSGWAWNTYQSPAQERRLMRTHFAEMEGGVNGPQSWMAALSTHMYDSGGLFQADCDGQGRTEFPHTILKHTLYLKQDEILLDSLSWVYDHTRGRMKWYPFTDNTSSGLAQHHDITFRPVFRHDLNGHPYNASSNASWVTDPVGGTANYFIPPSLEEVAGATLYPPAGSLGNTTFDPSGLNNGYLHPAPYVLLETPALNSTGVHYAGYDTDGELVNNGGNAGIEHDYVIDKPIDLRLINPQEKIIYNPSEADIDITGDYAGEPLVFPSGYTFRTVHGTHPSKSAVEAVDPGYIFPHPLLAPVPSTLLPNSSIYRIKTGSPLVIEPCVTIMDAEIRVEGGTLVYDPDQTYGNYDVTNVGGTIQTPGMDPPDAPCVAECFVIGFNDVGDLDIEISQTWSPGSMAPDANGDDILRIGGILRVKAGAFLQIDPGITLEFGPYGSLIVERGARVQAFETVFTNACHAMWPCVEVWGTRDASQDPLVGNPDQGFFSAIGCTFENAHVAVLVGRSGDPDGQFNGGVFRPTNCTFRNNGMDADVKPTRNMSSVGGGGTEFHNRCQFLSNQFITDGPLIDPAYHDGYLNPKAPEQHIRITGTNGIILSTNTFTNPPSSSTPFLPHLRGSGILAIDAIIEPRYNTFSGCSEAIWCMQGGTEKFLSGSRIRYNTITDCLHGIVTTATQFDEIVGNAIELPMSPQVGYFDTDPDQGYDYPVGIYTQGSSDFHFEGNVITGNETDGYTQYKSYGMVINQSNYGGELFGQVIETKSTSLIHMNTIAGVNIAIQCEGANRGGGLGTGSGLMIECNVFENGSPGDDHFSNRDITVVGNWIDLDEDIRGTLRDQGSCLFVETQAGNQFSGHNALEPELEHLYFDDHTDPDDFTYQDALDALPVNVETNAPILIPCIFNTERICESILGCDKPCLTEREITLKNLIQQLEDSLGNTTDSAHIHSLGHQIDLYRLRLRITYNSQARYALEFEELDSLQRIFNNDDGVSKLRKLAVLHLEKDELLTVDSLVQAIIIEEGVTSDHTLLLQLSQSIRSGQAITDEDLNMLKGMIEEEPLSAMPPKAILNHLRGEPYSRVPWMINDTRPGTRATLQRPGSVDDVTVWPNPAEGSLNVRASSGSIEALSILAPDGRTILSQGMDDGGDEAWIDICRLTSGTYLVRVKLKDEVIVRKVVVLPTRAP